MGNQNENPWFSIWKKPEQTIRQLLKKKSNQHIWIISALLSFSLAELVFVGLGYFEWVDKYSWQTVLLAIGIGILGSALHLNVGGFVLYHAGRWLYGSAKVYEVRTAIAWSSIPLIVAIPFWLPSILAMLSQRNEINLNILLALLILLVSIPIRYFVDFLYMFSFALLVRTLATVHRFSKWDAFFTLLIGSMPIVVPFIIYLLNKLLSEAKVVSLTIGTFFV